MPCCQKTARSRRLSKIAKAKAIRMSNKGITPKKTSGKKAPAKKAPSKKSKPCHCT